jgi:hypothetical protein
LKKAPARIAAASAALTLIGLTSSLAPSQTGPTPFNDVARVLQSPRCMNCHPAGDAPLQSDQSRPHKQNIKRVFSSLGGTCKTCHQDANLPGAHMPPGAPGWRMPPAETPMVFQGKSPAQLCVDLKDPNKNGHRSLNDLIHHVSADPLVLWGFNPGVGRTAPPLSHAAFVTRVTDWVALGAPCPN